MSTTTPTCWPTVSASSTATRSKRSATTSSSARPRGRSSPSSARPRRASTRFRPSCSSTAPPTPTLPGEFGLHRALSRIRAEERRGHRRRRARLLAAAAVLLVIVGAGSALAGRASAPSVVVAAPAAAADQPPGRLVTGSNGQIGAAAVVTPAAGWVRIALIATGLPPGEHCSVVVIARDGTEATAATWVVPQAGGQGTTINGSASIPDDDHRDHRHPRSRRHSTGVDARLSVVEGLAETVPMIRCRRGYERGVADGNALWSKSPHRASRRIDRAESFLRQDARRPTASE